MSKVLFTRFPLESTRGGAELQTIAVMEGLQKRDHTVAFLGSCPTLLHLCHERKIPAINLPLGKPPVTKWGAISFAWRRKPMQKKLLEILDGLSHLDTIVMLSLSEKLLLTEPALAKGIRVVWMEHDPVGRWLKMNPWLPQLRHLSQKVTTVVVSDLSRQLYIELGWKPGKVVTIPNGIDLARFQHISPPTPRTDHVLRLGCVARLAQEKGVDLLVEAVKKLPNTELTLVGVGREKNRIQSLIEQEKRIHLTHQVDSLTAFYGSIDTLVLPSRSHDPFGLVAAEAMACGLPVIVTAACGIAHYLEHGKTAIVVQAGSVEALQTGIMMLSNADARHSIAQAGKTFALQNFSETTMIDRYEGLLFPRN